MNNSSIALIQTNEELRISIVIVIVRAFGIAFFVTVRTVFKADLDEVIGYCDVHCFIVVGIMYVWSDDSLLS